MKLPSRPSSFKPQLAAPQPPSRKEAHAGLSPSLYAASGRRIRYRVHLLWQDPTTPSGRRQEVVEFSHPGRLLKLLQNIAKSPERPLVSATLEARPTPRWEPVTTLFLAWRAAERERYERGSYRGKRSGGDRG